MSDVAVIVPTHNRPHLLASTLRSILAQRDVQLTVAVVDDGSSDPRAVAGVLAAFGDPRLRLVRHDTPRGVSAARNAGIANTTSEWLAFCDDDDVWSPEKLAAQLATAQSVSAGWAYAGDVSIDGELRVLYGAPPLPPGPLVEELEHYNPVPAGSSNVIVHRRVLDVVGSFDPTLLSVGDWDMWIRLARHGLPACVPLPLVGCRVHGVTITRNRRLMLAEVALVATRHQVPVDLGRHFRWAAWNSMLDGRRFEAIGHYVQAVRQGDVASAGRAAVALVHPGIAHRRQTRSMSTWASSAQAWLDALRAHESQPRHDRAAQEPG